MWAALPSLSLARPSPLSHMTTTSSAYRSDLLNRLSSPTGSEQMMTYFSDGTALNIDGSVHDAMNGIHTLTKREQIWLFENGWGG